MTRDAFDEVRPEEYSVAHEAAQLGLLLVNKVDSHEHLQGAEIAYVFRDEEIRTGSKVEWASAHLAARLVSSRHWGRMLRWSIKQLTGIDPDFVMLIDRNIWDGLSPEQKLALVDHELCHMAQSEDADGLPRFNQVTGEPIWCIRPHDVEEFDEIVRRHGLWKEDLVSFARETIDALNNGRQLPQDLQEEIAE